MKTGNGMKDSANKHLFKGGMKTETSNIVKKKAPVTFSAKRDSFKGKKS